MEIRKQKLPEVQYALFCRELIQDEELTFRDVMDEVFVGRPKEIAATLVLGLRNVPRGLHNVKVNCLIPPTELLNWTFDIRVNETNNLFIAEVIRMPIRYSSTYIFTILFNESPITRLSLPVHVIWKEQLLNVEKTR
jgi:hypothetical protein